MSEQGIEDTLPFLRDGVAQVGLVVRDLDRTVECYWKQYGIGPWHFYTYRKPLVKQMTYRGQPADYAMRIALAWIGPLRIELIEMAGRRFRLRRFCARARVRRPPFRRARG